MTNLKNLTQRAFNGLQELKNLLEVIDDKAYVKPIAHLNKSSIGEHTRHILEIYIELINGIENATVNYDNRKRNHLLESVSQEAIFIIEKLQSNLPVVNKELTLAYTSKDTNELYTLPSNISRELLYNIEHNIHHVALIRAGLIELGLDHLIDSYFGYADSTVIYKKDQVSS